MASLTPDSIELRAEDQRLPDVLSGRLCSEANSINFPMLRKLILRDKDNLINPLSPWLRRGSAVEYVVRRLSID